MENFLKKNYTLFRIIGACCFLLLSTIKFITMIIELFGSIFGVSSPLHSFLLCSVYAFLGIILLIGKFGKNNLLLMIGAGALVFFELIYFFVGFGNGAYRASYLFGGFNFLVFLLAFFDLIALFAMAAVLISKLIGSAFKDIVVKFFFIPAGVVITVLFFAIIFKIILGSGWNTSGTYLNFISIFNRLLLTGGVFTVCMVAILDAPPAKAKAPAPRPAAPYQQPYTQAPQYQPQQYSQPIGNQQQIQQQLQQRYNQAPQAPQAPSYQAPQAPEVPQVPEAPQAPEVPAAPAAPAADPVAELKKYKDLLDLGVITQEEFDAKKRQILGF